MTTEIEVNFLDWAVNHLSEWPVKPTRNFGVGWAESSQLGEPPHHIFRIDAEGVSQTVYRADWVKARIAKCHALLMQCMWQTVGDIYSRSSAQAQALISDNITAESSKSDKSTETVSPKVTIKFDDDSSPSAVGDSIRKYIEESGPIIPERQPSDWSGPEDGDPPLHTVCEMEVNANKWRPVKISAYTDKSVIVEYLDTGREEAISREAKWAFRPDTSKRSIEVEEMLKYCLFPGSTSSKVDCESLYDAGWRKPIGRAPATKVIAEIMASGDVSQERLAEKIADALGIGGPA